jgi:GAF domain-containing protein
VCRDDRFGACPVIDAGDLDLQRSLTELVGLLPAGETFEDTLRRIVVLACQTVEGCESASVTLLGTSDGPSTVVHTDDLALRLDELQYENGTGPCLQAARDGETPVAVRSMEAETRWGAYPARAFALGARSSYSVPLAVQARPTGALNLYSKKVDAFTAASHHTGALFGGQAAVAIANAQVYDASRRLVAQMEDALRSRAVIEQAKGILMAERAVDANAAFDLLRAASQRENVKLRDIAQRLVDSK